MSKKTILPSVLAEIFSPATRDWFVCAFQHPTPVQAQTWAATNAGEHVLAIAPTGSGKTLAAFLYALDQLYREGDAPAEEAVERKNHAHSLYLADKSPGQRHSAQLTDPVTGHQRTAEKTRRAGSGNPRGDAYRRHLFSGAGNACAPSS
jgi:ATP-dependent Lhr-like helicase